MLLFESPLAQNAQLACESLLVVDANGNMGIIQTRKNQIVTAYKDFRFDQIVTESFDFPFSAAHSMVGDSLGVRRLH